MRFPRSMMGETPTPEVPEIPEIPEVPEIELEIPDFPFFFE